MKISVLIPCHNEEKTIADCLVSCFNQTRPADEIVVVNDGSTDNSALILEKFRNKITIVNIPKATGNKSHAQEYGLRYVNGDIFITTDADTILDEKFIEEVEKSFIDDEGAVAVSGYVKSIKINWLTALRAMEYIIGQNIHKTAQSYMNFIFVVPGAGGAFRTKWFKKTIAFEHDTLTEDLDFTYRLNKKKMKISFNRKAVVYTQDPSDLKSYIRQMRRWYGGGWQNLSKHFEIITQHPYKALELSMVYSEGMVFSIMLFLMPFINFWLFYYSFNFSLFVVAILSVYAAIIDKRADVAIYSPFYAFIMFINSWIFLEQFFKQVVFRKRNLTWVSPDRIEIDFRKLPYDSEKITAGQTA